MVNAGLRHGVSYAAFWRGTGDDVGPAERLCEHLASLIQSKDLRQPGVHPAAADLAFRILRRLHHRLGGARGPVVGRACWRSRWCSPCRRSANPPGSSSSPIVWQRPDGGDRHVRRHLAEKFDHIAAFQNFSSCRRPSCPGVLSPIHSPPDFWQSVAFQPVLFMIDGFRRGFFGQSDVSPWLSLAVAGGCFVAHVRDAPGDARARGQNCVIEAGESMVTPEYVRERARRHRLQHWKWRATRAFRGGDRERGVRRQVAGRAASAGQSRPRSANGQHEITRSP